MACYQRNLTGKLGHLRTLLLLVDVMCTAGRLPGVSTAM